MLNFGSIVFTGVSIVGNVGMSGVSDVVNVKGIVENVIQSNKTRTGVEDKLKRLQEEYDFGQIDAAKYQQLRKQYEEEQSKY
jgi:hypothetical protein